MKILEVLTYYRPHISGLTIYVERLSKALAKRGHEVTVFTSHYARELPHRETKDGVRIERVPVAFRLSKGVIMPTFGPRAWNMVRQADVVHLHLPQFDAPGLAFRGRLFRKPVILTYHSDLRLPPGLGNRVVDQVVGILNRAAGLMSDAVVTYTYDFGTHSPFLRRFVGKKLHVIPPPVEVDEAAPDDVRSFRTEHQIRDHRIIGIAARLAAEKGIEVLLAALPAILQRHPNARVLHANPDAIGEDAYLRHLSPLLERHKQHYHLIGALQGSQLTAFYRNLDCLVMCSLNNTETFGLVQIEAMINEVPVVSCDLPGVRQPVTMTGMGEITKTGDHEQLAAAVNRVLEDRDRYVQSAGAIADTFSPDSTAAEYEALFMSLMEGRVQSGTTEPPGYERLRRLRSSSASAVLL